MLTSLTNKLRDLFRGPDDDGLVTLVQLASEDESIRRQLLSMLQLPQQDRVKRLQQRIIELQAAGAPPLLVEILEQLREETTANQALIILEKIELKSSA